MGRPLIGTISALWELGLDAARQRRNLMPDDAARLLGRPALVEEWRWVIRGYRRGLSLPSRLEQLDLFAATGDSCASVPSPCDIGPVATSSGVSPREPELSSPADA